jgi:hypothetical protein
MTTALAYAIPLAFASGLNLYATVAVLGLCSHFGLVALPEQFRAFDNTVVIGVALFMYALEFVADKVPWFDSVWDAIHTVIRPIGGAFVAATAMAPASPMATALAALLGGSVAFTTHAAKASTRGLANTSPEPFSNWILSFVEDIVAAGLSYITLTHPVLAVTIALVLLAAIGLMASFVIRALRRRLAGEIAR